MFNFPPAVAITVLLATLYLFLGLAPIMPHRLDDRTFGYCFGVAITARVIVSLMV